MSKVVVTAKDRAFARELVERMTHRRARHGGAGHSAWTKAEWTPPSAEEAAAQAYAEARAHFAERLRELAAGGPPKSRGQAYGRIALRDAADQIEKESQEP